MSSSKIPVRISRSALPDRGLLYATGGGLFFVPQSVARVRMVPVERHSPRSMLSALLRAPLGILRRGVALGAWGAYRSPMRVAISTHELPLLRPEDTDRLIPLLMDDPGVFFFSRRSIRTIRRTFSGWALVRPNNLTLRIKPLGDRAAFHKRMSAYADEVREAVCR